MKTTKLLPLVIFLSSIISPTNPAFGAVLIDSPSAPTITGEDIIQTQSDGTLVNNADYSDQNPAQSFTSGGNVGGYLLNSVTLHGSGGSGGDWLTNSYTISVYDTAGTGLTPTSGAVNSNNFTSIYSETFVFDGTANATDYLTFQFTTPVNLAANKLYTFAMTQVGFGWFGFTRSIGDAYSGGNAGTFWSPTYYGSGDPGYDREFYLDATAVPEPSALILCGIGIAMLVIRRRSEF